MNTVLQEAPVETLTFAAFKRAVQWQFTRMTAGDTTVFVVDVSSEELWTTYLGAFGNEPIYRKRGEHDCSCCRHFIRDIGAAVTINKDGQMQSIWDCDVSGDARYTRVAAAMSALIHSRPIRDVFLTAFPTIGTDRNRATIEGRIVTFDHFHLATPTRCVLAKDRLDTRRGELRTTRELLKRAMMEITPTAVQETLDLIASNSIYRGEEHRNAVVNLQNAQRAFDASGMDVDTFTWAHLSSPSARIKNTAIGTLLVDLSDGRGVEEAVKSFEAKVAPQNYKRPTALVTPKMIENAKAKVAELGLLDAMERRYANLADVSVNNVLFADRSARKVMKGGSVFDDVAASVPTNARAFDRAETINIERFLSDVLPTAEHIDVLFENKHAGNLVSLVTEVTPDSPRLLKWNNPFSWSYNGDLTDSIKERVKARGGNVTGELCCRLAWNNHDDLDFHMVEPGGFTIFYGTRSTRSPGGGALDVDANAGFGTTRTPVENIYYTTLGRMQDGTYGLAVHQFSSRESKDNTFTVEIDLQGDVLTVEGANPRQGVKLPIATIQKQGQQVTVTPLLPSTSAPRTLWGITSGQFLRVNALMFSPNHWEGEAGTGNRHYFFLLDGCVNDGNARGFYNEFLRGELDEHRKVLELVGSRQRTQETPDQLSGLGFSSTKKDVLVVRVTGKVSRVLKINF